MSLKAFHIVFVIASILLTLGFGVWSTMQYFSGGTVMDLIFGAGSLLCAVALIVYGKYVLKKLKDISYL